MPRFPLLYFGLLSLSAAAQVTGNPPSPAATPPASPAAAQSPSPTATLRSRTDLVVVDVVVTDRSGKNVTGLKQSDFSIAEDGSAQALRSFDEHTAPAQPPSPEPPLQLPPGVFTNYEPVPHTDALNVLLFDTLNTPYLDQSYVHGQLLDYLRHASPGDRIAIFGLTTHLIYLQGFTSDPALLRAAIDKKSMRRSQLLSNTTRGGGGDEMSKSLESVGDPHLAGAIARVRELEAKEQSMQVGLRAAYTLGALNALARYLAGLPGRKNLIWFSGSFPLNITPDISLADPFAPAAELGDDLRDTSRLLNNAQIAIYPVDARGLFNDSVYDPSQRGTLTVPDFNRDLAKNSTLRMEEFATMRALADQTGGRAFVNNNGFKEAVATVLRTGANFYTLTYTPTNRKTDGHFRHISVHLQGAPAQANLTLSYRRGYFAFPDTVPAGTSQRKSLATGGATAPVALGSTTALRSAMQRGAPATSGIIFKAQILPATAASAAPDAAPDPANRVNTDPKLAHGPWRRYTVDLAASPAQLLRRSPDGSYTGIAEFVTYCFNDDGAIITSTSQIARLTLPAGHGRDPSSAVQMQEVISVPDRGSYHLRVGLHSLTDNRVGSLEIPVSEVRELAPAPPPNTAPAATQ